MGNHTGGVMQNKMWMLGMMLIAFFVGMMFSQNTAAQQGELGRYQIATARYDDYFYIIRVDTRNGQMWTCFHNDGSAKGLGCERWTSEFETRRDND
tara:strand:+ start:2493 stop:2780 length:288 start_codon:yes stop_codon:yes gene_type:complete